MVRNVFLGRIPTYSLPDIGFPGEQHCAYTGISGIIQAKVKNKPEKSADGNFIMKNLILTE